MHTIEFERKKKGCQKKHVVTMTKSVISKNANILKTVEFTKNYYSLDFVIIFIYAIEVYRKRNTLWIKIKRSD